MDPPWENKHVKRTLTRRRKVEKIGIPYNHSSGKTGNSTTSYQMLSNEIMAQQLPINQFLNKSNGLLVIFCSNSKRHQMAIQDWIKNWGLVNVTKWYWLKVGLRSFLNYKLGSFGVGFHFNTMCLNHQLCICLLLCFR